MTYSYDQNTLQCGPAALAYAGGWSIDEVIENWPGGWSDTGDLWNNLNDWPDDHRLCIQALTNGSKVQKAVTLTDMIGEQAPKDKTVVLLHLGHTHKHWVVWHDTDETGLSFHFGDGSIQHFPFDRVVDLFTDSTPNFAYKIVSAPIRLSWWQSARRWLGGLFARWT